MRRQTERRGDRNPTLGIVAIMVNLARLVLELLRMTREP